MLERWQAICGAVLLTAAVVGLILRGIRRMWRLFSKANRWFDQALGEPANGDKPARPGLLERQALMEQDIQAIKGQLAEQGSRLAEHVEWHGDPGGEPAYNEGGPVLPNGGTARRRRR